jgi:hypothetical protein
MRWGCKVTVKELPRERGRHLLDDLLAEPATSILVRNQTCEEVN